MEQEHNLPAEQVARLLCEELEACIKSYLPQEEGEQQEQEEQGADQARDEATLQLYNRSVELLNQQGFEEVVRQALTDNASYYAHLFGRAQASQFHNLNLRMRLGEETATLIRDSFQELSQGESIKPPQHQDYLHHFPPPYDELFTGVFLVDTLFQRARHVMRRDMMREKMEG